MLIHCTSVMLHCIRVHSQLRTGDSERRTDQRRAKPNESWVFNIDEKHPSKSSIDNPHKYPRSYSKTRTDSTAWNGNDAWRHVVNPPHRRVCKITTPLTEQHVFNRYVYIDRFTSVPRGILPTVRVRVVLRWQFQPYVGRTGYIVPTAREDIASPKYSGNETTDYIVWTIYIDTHSIFHIVQRKYIATRLDGHVVRPIYVYIATRSGGHIVRTMYMDSRIIWTVYIYIYILLGNIWRCTEYRVLSIGYGIIHNIWFNTAYS